MKPEQWRPSTALKKRRSNYFFQVDVTGVAGIFFVFVFVFLAMIVIPERPRPAVDLAPAFHATAMPAALKEDALIVTVTRDATIFFKNHRVVFDELPQLLRQGYQSGSERKVFLVADARAKYRDVAAVVSTVRQAGIEKISLIVESPVHSSQN